jgi:hypothetical protein
VVKVNFDGQCTQSQLLVGYKNRNNIRNRHWIKALQPSERTLDDIVSNNKVLDVNP